MTFFSWRWHYFSLFERHRRTNRIVGNILIHFIIPDWNLRNVANHFANQDARYSIVSLCIHADRRDCKLSLLDWYTYLRVHIHSNSARFILAGSPALFLPWYERTIFFLLKLFRIQQRGTSTTFANAVFKKLVFFSSKFVIFLEVSYILTHFRI